MFIKREPTPYKEHEVNTPYSTSNFRDWRFVYGVFGHDCYVISDKLVITT
jgi:hypothetical protein